MIKVLLKCLIFLLLVEFSLTGYTQNITNVDFFIKGNSSEISYTLQDKQDRSFKIELFYKFDNSSNWEGPLKSVTGDVGIGIKSGTKKVINWNIKEEIGLISGNISFKVIGNIMESNSIIKKEVHKSVFIDQRDGQKYKFTEIGEQIWMAENLNYSTLNGSWCYNNVLTNCEKFGRLYNWNTAINKSEENDICPFGWHLPSDKEWSIMLQILGENSAMDLKSITDWAQPGHNTYEFSVLPSGYIKSNISSSNIVSQIHSNIGNQAHFWTRTKFSSTTSYVRSLFDGDNLVYKRSTNISNALSIRCIKN